jgi:hypothetical protein
MGWRGEEVKTKKKERKKERKMNGRKEGWKRRNGIVAELEDRKDNTQQPLFLDRSLLSLDRGWRFEGVDIAGPPRDAE